MNLSRYRAVLTTPAVPRLLGAALVGRLPVGMLAFAIVLHLVGTGRSYATAGAVTAAYTIGTAVLGPIWSRAVDRRGQTVVLVGLTAVFVPVTLLLGLLPSDAPTGVLIAVGTAVGVTAPPVSASARALWPTVVPRGPLLDSMYALESTMQELTFILGPLLVAVVSALLGTGAAVVSVAVVGATGTLTFAASDASRRWRGTRGDRQGGSSLRSPGLRLLTLLMGLLVGSLSVTEVATVARVGGDTSSAGVLMSVWSAGSMVGGLLYGARHWPGTPPRHLVGLLGACAVTTLALVVAAGGVSLGAVLVVAGAAIAPSLACVYVLAERVAVPGTVTESFAWLFTASHAGAALGAAGAGAAIDAKGAGAGFLIAAAMVTAALVTAALARPVLERSSALVPASAA